MRKWILLFCCCAVSASMAQLSDGYRELKAFASGKEILSSDTSFFLGTNYKNSLHYFYPFYKAFYREDFFKKKDSAFYYDQLTQRLCMAGDYASVLQIDKQRAALPAAVSTTSIDTLTRIISEYADAHKYILAHTGNRRVVMINEAQNRPQHRAFVLSLLDDLYRQGFRYLAMDALYNPSNKAVTRLNAATGFYTAEPIAGEIVRKALELGFTLVPYEDNETGHSSKQREYTQAQNLADFLSKKDSTEKMLVLAGNDHIEETAWQDDQIRMAAYFRIITGIDPLTIDQTQLTEFNTDPSQAQVYDAWIRKHPLGNPSLILAGNEPLDLFGWHFYDLQVIHPPTRFNNGRPVWLAAYGIRKETPVSAAYRTTFFVQAYYANEYTDKTAGQMIPADQTYHSPNGMYTLFLRKGKYRIVFRDKSYTVLGTKELVVD